MHIRKFKVFSSVIFIVLIASAGTLAYTFYSSSKHPAILIVFNGDHDQEAENLFKSIQKNAPSLLPYINVCISDPASEAFAARNNLKSFRMSDIKESGAYKSRAMNIMTKRKFEAVLHLLESKQDVLYSDTDIVFLSNPLPDINLHYDINIQNDLCQPPYHNSYLCTGFIYIKSNARTIAFVKSILARIVQFDFKYGDQITFNSVIRTTKHNLKIHALDACKYPNGCRYFEGTDMNCKKSDAVIVHNNYLSGIDNKLRRFKENGLLF